MAKLARTFKVLFKQEDEVAKDAGSVEAAFFAYLEEVGYEEATGQARPRSYTLEKRGETDGGAALWFASDYAFVSVFLIDQGDNPEVFIAFSESAKEHRLSPEAAEAIPTEVVESLGYDAEAWSAALLDALTRSEATCGECGKELREHVEKTAEDNPELPGTYAVVKADTEQRYTLGVAYPADELDIHGDFTTATELERAAWDFVKRGPLAGTDHAEGTDDAGDPVESYIYRGPTWEIEGQTIESGDWMLGVVWSEKAWERIQRGELTGYSMQGFAQRVEEGEE